MNDDTPVWWKVLNLEDSGFERSKFAGNSYDGQGAFRMKDLAVMRKVAPRIYEQAAGDVKEYNDALFASRGQVRKYNIGRKIGSIPMWDVALHPELAHDKAAQDKYLQEHPEFKCTER